MDSPRGRIQLMEAHARRHDLAQPNRRRALRSLPRLHGVRHRVPVRRAVRPADRGDARDDRDASSGARRPSASSAARSSSCSRTRGGWARRCASRRSAASCRCRGRLQRDDRDRAAVALDREAGAEYARAWRDARRVSAFSQVACSRWCSAPSTPRRRGCSRPTATRSSRRHRAAAARSRCTPGRATRRARVRPPADRGVRAASRRVIVNTSGCGSHLKELGHVLGDDPAWAERAAAFSARVRDLGEFLDDVEPRATRHPLNAHASRCRTPATSGTRSGCRSSSAASLRADPRADVVEPAEQDICCGSAGIYNVTQPDAARELGDRKARTCWRPARRPTRARTPAASSRSRRRSAARSTRCRPSTRSRSSTRRSAECRRAGSAGARR